MKMTPLRSIAFAAVTAATLLTAIVSASADELNIRIGSAPPAPRQEKAWARPYKNAVWVAGHYEPRGGAWVWVGGYYAYPPSPRSKWVPGYYGHNEWHAGHWSKR